MDEVAAAGNIPKTESTCFLETHAEEQLQLKATHVLKSIYERHSVCPGGTMEGLLVRAVLWG